MKKENPLKTVLPQQRDILCDLLEASLLELLEAYGVRADASDAAWSEADEHQPGIAGVIGYTSDVMRGSLVVYGFKSVLASMGQTDGSDLALRDWAGEVANQLLGRFKNKLLHYGVVLTMTTPVVVVGFRLDVTSVSGMPRISSGAVSSYGRIRVALDAVADPDALVSAVESIPMGASEGEVLLF